MDAQFWIYIIIGVIYFLSRLLKKGEQATQESTENQRPVRREPRQTAQPASDAPRELTFEELLREITEGKQVQRPQPQREVAPQYESYEKDLGDEARSLEEVDVDEASQAPRWKPYEEIPVRSAERRSLEETLRLEDTVMTFGKFDVFEKKTKKNYLDDYIRIMRNPESLKQAVVMSEILKRKF
jgi:hypothetical protein